MSVSMNSVYNDYIRASQQLSSGNRINSAADDAAGAAIIEKLVAQETGLSRGTSNTYDMQNLVKTAEGGMAGISDMLQRIRELSLQAANGTLEQSDKQIIQNEINQLVDGINSMSGATEFNNQKLLDGSFTNKHTASYADGSGKDFSIGAMNAEALGLSGFDVTGTFDLNVIDKALDTVNSARSKLGAIYNSFDSVINSNSITELNLAAAKSRMADTDIAKASMDYNKNKLLIDYQVLSQKRQMETEKSKLSILG